VRVDSFVVKNNKFYKYKFIRKKKQNCIFKLIRSDTLMFQPDTRTFAERLQVGNEKEEYLVDILNLCMVPAKLNNETVVTDVDIELTADDMYVDCKYIETPFMKAKQYTGIEADSCMLINKKHVEAYAKKEEETGKKVWVAFLVDFEVFGVHELRFVPNSYLMHQIKLGKNLNGNKLNVDKNVGRDMYSFLDYVYKMRKIKRGE
jgi:hypothetical protein